MKISQLNSGRLLALAATLVMIPAISGAFTAGNLAVIQADSSGSNTTFSVLELLPGSANPTPVNTIAVPGTGTGALRISSSATSTLYFSASADRSMIACTAASSENTTANANTLNPRAVVAFHPDNSVTVPTTYTGVSGQQTRAATTIDNTNWFITEGAGLFTNGGTAASPTGNFRTVHVFNNTVYGSATSASTVAIGTFSSFTGSTYVPAAGMGPISSFQDFYMVASGAHGSDADVMYITTATSNTAGSIQKYSNNGGTWVSNGSQTTTYGGFGIAARKINVGGAELFISTGLGALTANSVLRVTDTAGYNETIHITTTDTIYTAPAGKIVKGVEWAPVSAAQPNSVDVHVDLQDTSGPSGYVAQWELRDTNGSPITSGAADLNPSGNFHIDLFSAANGDYILWVKSSTFLASAHSLTLSGGTANASYSLINGDVDGDNEVGLGDFGILSGAFGMFDGDPGFVDGADLDNDGEVGLADFGILSANFGLLGD